MKRTIESYENAMEPLFDPAQSKIKTDGYLFLKTKEMLSCHPEACSVRKQNLIFGKRNESFPPDQQLMVPGLLLG
ncbi:MAG: hypothetical protein K9L89_05355 [Kiritimatiellales bacterium]|nr:hypothetical protein [Kiritimatiellales bacterium]